MTKRRKSRHPLRARARRRRELPPRTPPPPPRAALACLRCGFGATCIEHGDDFRRCTVKCVLVANGQWLARAANTIPKSCARCHSHEWRVPWTGKGRRPSDPPNPRWAVDAEAAELKRRIRDTARENMLAQIEEAERKAELAEIAAEEERTRPKRHDYIPPVAVMRIAPSREMLQAGLEHGIPPPPRIAVTPSPTLDSIISDFQQLAEITNKMRVAEVADARPEPATEFALAAERGESEESQ
jgi:hypothetical protein